MSVSLSFILHVIILSLVIFILILVLYVLRKHLTIVFHNIHWFSTIKFCPLLLLMPLKILIILFISCHYHLSSTSFLLVSISSIAYSIPYILEARFSLPFLKYKTDNTFYFWFLQWIFLEVMFFLCVRSLFVSFMFQKIFLGYTCIIGLPWPGIHLLLLGPPHCFFWMVWDFSPRILIWKTGWWKFTLPARDKQPEGLGVILCRGHFFSTLCTAVPDMSYRSWSLSCSPALCVWEPSRPIMGEPGLGKRCLSLDLMAQPLLKALGLHRER